MRCARRLYSFSRRALCRGGAHLDETRKDEVPMKWFYIFCLCIIVPIALPIALAAFVLLAAIVFPVALVIDAAKTLSDQIPPEAGQ